MQNQAIWVVVANENSAAICASTEGSSQLISMVSRKLVYAAHAVDAQRIFALQIMSELHRGIRDGACGGLILIAGKSLLEMLQQVAIPEVNKHLVAQIVGEPKADLEANYNTAMAAAC